MTFGITFSISFPGRLNLVICNNCNAKTFYLSFQASHFNIKNQSTNHVFSKPFLGPPFSNLFSEYFVFKNGRVWDPLQNPMGAKMAPIFHVFNINHAIPRIIKLPFFKPCFHETIVITVPLGLVAFKRSFLSMEIGSFSVLVAFRCALFNTTLLSLFFIKHR